MAEPNFEEALRKLEKLVEELEDGNLSLDTSLKKYEEGIGLVKYLSKKLEQVRKRVDIMVKSKGEKMELKPFEPEVLSQDD